MVDVNPKDVQRKDPKDVHPDVNPKDVQRKVKKDIKIFNLNTKIKKLYLMTKKKIPKAIRQQVWLKNNGEVFKAKCNVIWCKNIISVFNFHVGHNVPESKGGGIEIENLRPICPNCNLSMGSKYSIDEWNKICDKRQSFCTRIMNFFFC